MIASAAVIPDREEANLFLDLLEPEGLFHFQFAPEAEGSTARPGHVHGTLDEVWHRLAELNAAGAAIWVQINAGRGRKDSEIDRVRAYFVDIDEGDGADLLDPAADADLIVESSPGKYHGYWLSGEVPLDQFKLRQQMLADRFRGDPKVCNLGRVMRLPGFVHHKGAPFMCRVLRTKKGI